MDLVNGAQAPVATIYLSKLSVFYRVDDGLDCIDQILRTPVVAQERICVWLHSRIVCFKQDTVSHDWNILITCKGSRCLTLKIFSFQWKFNFFAKQRSRNFFKRTYFQLCSGKIKVHVR